MVLHALILPLIFNAMESRMAKKAKRRRTKRVAWTRAQVAELRRYSKDKLRVKKVSRLMKRTVGSLRQKARALGIRLGHRR
jgi:hypothetical protein